DDLAERDPVGLAGEVLERAQHERGGGVLRHAHQRTDATTLQRLHPVAQGADGARRDPCRSGRIRACIHVPEPSPSPTTSSMSTSSSPRTTTARPTSTTPPSASSSGPRATAARAS